MRVRTWRPPGRVALVYRLAAPRRQTTVNQISVTQRLTELLRARTDLGGTAALRRELAELRRRVDGLSGRPRLDAAIRRAVEEYQKKHPLPANKPPRPAGGTRRENAGWLLLLPPMGRGAALLRAPLGALPPLRLALRRWARPASGEAPGPPPVPLRHRRPAPPARETAEDEAGETARGERALAAQRVRPETVSTRREETVTRTEVLRLIHEIPPPDLADLTDRVTERLENTLRTERRRYGRE